ncbi:MAG: hypothetical protein V4671_15515 [Armatimonadota bacterium]
MLRHSGLRDAADAVQPADSGAPFVIEHGRRNVDRGGYFTPAARLVVTPTLRTSGLLAALSDREVKSLLLLLTYLTPNGRIEPTTAQIARALHVPEIVVRSRMGRLTAFRWRGERIVRYLVHENGLDGYRVSHTILAERSELEAGEEAGTGPAVVSSSSRDAVIAFNRAAYARPREEVERDIERRLGYFRDEEAGETDVVSSESPEAREVRRRLQALGVAPAQVERLLAEHSLHEVREQLDWLPHRAARSPARYVVAAIEGRYEAPARVRLELAIAEEEGKMAEETAGSQGSRDGVTTQNAVRVLPGLPSLSDLPEPILLYDSEAEAGATGEAKAEDADHAVGKGI